MYFCCICGEEGDLHVLLLCHLEGPLFLAPFYNICLFTDTLLVLITLFLTFVHAFL